MSAGIPDDPYLTWLYTQVSVVRTRKSSRTFYNLFEQLFSTEFAWFVPNDDNRAADGRELRSEWFSEHTVTFRDPPRDFSAWLTTGCSFLEMLVGLSRRLEFEAGETTAVWFWDLINNLGLLGFHDRSNFCPEEVDDITHAVMFRTYDQNGNGGLFPLRHSSNDQRTVEIWYQLSEYLLQDG